MRYQLVLQFAASTRMDFGQLVSLEQALVEDLAGAATIDGHDFGLGEFNIFIFTDDPASTLEKARRLIDKQTPATDWKAGYREVTAEKYTALWPPTLQHFTVA